MKNFIYNLLYSAHYLLLNGVVSHVPCWHLRKFAYMSCGMKIGKGSRIMRNVIVQAPWKICIGERSIINEYAFIDGRGGIKIGNDVSVSIYTKIITGSHGMKGNSFEYKSGFVELKDNVWTGANAIILGDSTLNEFSVLGAGSVFTKGTAEQNWFYAGVPAKKVSYRSVTNKYSCQLGKGVFGR